MRISPAIAICAKVYSRLLKSAPLTLVKPSGEILKWPPKDGRSASSPAYQILRLWSECPNWLQSREQFLEMLAYDWVHSGEGIARLYRAGTDVPNEMRILSAERVNLTGTVIGSFPDEHQEVLIYHYGGISIQVHPERPELFHMRSNVDPHYQYRGRPAVWGMPYEVKASALASIYRSEIFRQGGPVRTAIKASSESRVAMTLEQKQRIADKLAQEMKRSESWMKNVTVLPEDFDFTDFGPKGEDEMYVKGSRYIDEKLTSVYGVPLLYQGNMEKGTYNNSRQQIAILVESAGGSMFEEIQSVIKRCMLLPIGGETAKLTPKFDLAVAQRGELALWNKIITDRIAAGIISINEARVSLDYEKMDGKMYDKPKDTTTPKAPMPKAPAPDAKGTAKPPADK